ncbi:hypothetical protein [Sansalvadorimonas verongulae]|uniref:hypothetical protein n=1 Tax=Sansalvadorimonas verongulae TaxID=2172824 RepID=UPI0012BC4E21|nr:hypothetical protein [Sansalvadorimonas verongulae]MTI13819.1 hypothetical protein [Sansalvadorimonas verongulae]
MSKENNPKYTLDIKEACCHHCGNVCDYAWDENANSYVSLCHGVGFDYENSNGDIQSEGDGLRYISDWNE